MSASASPNKRRVPVSPVARAQQLAHQTSLWEALVRFDPLSRSYTRLAKTDDHEAWLLTWLPGQGTDWHDHGGSAGAFVTLRGTLTEEHAVRERDQVLTRVPGARELGAGSLRAFGRQHVHRVGNHALEPAVSLHVYSPALIEMNAYSETRGLLPLTGSQLAGVNR